MQDVTVSSQCNSCRTWKALAKRYKRAHANALHSLDHLVQQHRDLDEHVSRLLDIQGAMALQIERAEDRAAWLEEREAALSPAIKSKDGPKGKVQ